ncbi:MAG: 1-acyl-sn-glycerol-3-phosphate acyltransferase [Pseudomonadota bacterium]|nr:1-acyl-sn-glycerol-3-phosphate acyltransferase [Pseudomonadota bacterium]
MALVRNLLFYFVFYLGTIGFFLFFSPVRFFSDRLIISLSNKWARWVISMSKLILGINYEIKGKENIPKSGPFLIVSNHQAAWETFFLGSFFFGSVFILKNELSRIPIFSEYLRRLGFIFIRREKAFSSLKVVLRSIKESIGKGKRMFIIFPEGTRLQPGQKVKFSAGFFAIHRFLGLPVLPIKHNSGEYWNNKFLKRKGTIKITIFPLIRKEPKKESAIRIIEKYFY